MAVNEPDLEPEQDLTVQVYMRPGLLLEPLDAKLDTLQRLETEDVIDAVTVQAWPDTVPLTDTTPYTEVVDLFNRFTLWADQQDRSITPPFTVRTQSTIASDDSRRILTTPMLCLAVYSDQMLTAVYPHTDGDDHYSVADAIAALKTGEFDQVTSATAPESTLAETAVQNCPDCTGQLINIQGVRACRDCMWTERTTPPRESREINLVAQ